MHLHRHIHVAFLGVGLATAAKIQQAMTQAVVNPEQLIWTSINDAQMDILVVDRAFQEAHSVRKVLSYRPVPVLSVERQVATAIQLAEHVLYLPIHQPQAIAQWLRDQLHQPSPHTSLRLEIERPSSQTHQHLDTVCVARLLHPQTGLVKLMSATGMLGIADTGKEQLWLWPDSAAQFDHTFNLSHATARELSVIGSQPIDLRQWLWNAIWQTSSTLGLLEPHDALQLHYWPQPTALAERRKILSLAALLEHQPCGVQQLQQRSGWSMSDVQRFADAMLLTGFAQRTSVEPPQAPIVASLAEQRGWRGLFGKLRQHLGL